MQHVADDDHPSAVEVPAGGEMALQRVGVEQGLGRVLVGAVPRIDHAALDPG